jgi:hypothetical protein
MAQAILSQWNDKWKQSVQDVSQMRDSISVQARVSREKLNFFRDHVSELSEKQVSQWEDYTRIHGLGPAHIQTPELRDLVRAGVPRRFRGERLWLRISI